MPLSMVYVFYWNRVRGLGLPQKAISTRNMQLRYPKIGPRTVVR